MTHAISKILIVISAGLVLCPVLMSQQPGFPTTLPQPTPPPKSEKEKAQEELDKAQAELDKAKANMEKIEKAESNQENNRKLVESLEKELKNAVDRKDKRREEAIHRLLNEVNERLKKDPAQDTGKLLGESMAAHEKKYGQLPPDLKSRFKSDTNARSKIDTKSEGIGRTTGHIGNMEARNAGHEPFTFSLPEMEVPSDGIHQGYIIESTPPVTIAPGASVIIPLNGYCTDVFRDPVPDGFDFPLFDSWSVNTPLTQTCFKVKEFTRELQLTGDYHTPFSDDPQKEITTVTQNVIWLTESLDGMYTFEDICTDITQQVETVTGKPIASLPPEEYTAFRNDLDDLINMINDVGIRSQIPSLLPSPVIPEEFLPDPFPAPVNPAFGNSITVKGTGRTTGHIADITFTNPTKDPAVVQIGSGNGLYIPSSGQYQPYIVPSLGPVSLSPGETKTIPVDGYCVDIHRPPVPAGGGMPGLSDWYSIPLPSGIKPDPNIVTIPTHITFHPGMANDILINSLPLVWSSLDEGCIPAVNQITPVIPGTGRPVPGGGDGLFSPGQMPEVAVPVLLDALLRISRTYDEMKKEQNITTPFSGNPEKEREAVIQQTFWMYTSGLGGKQYKKDDFQNNTVRQFEQSTGKKYEALPTEQKDKLDAGVDDFWDTFAAVGVEAKVLEVPPVLPDDPVPPPQDIWEPYDVGNTKATPANTAGFAPEEMPMPDGVMLSGSNEGEPKCKCGKISFKIWGPGFRDKIEMTSEMTHKEIELDSLHYVTGKYKKDEEGPVIYMEDIHVDCNCSTSGKCNFYPRNTQFDAKEEDKVSITSSKYNVYQHDGFVILKLKISGLYDPLKFKIHAWCKGDSCAETKDCMEYFTIEFKQKKQ